MVGGVTAPKKVVAYDANHRAYPQLVKSGDDDLRQDAVVQQVFTQVNSLLWAAPETRERGLRVQTYKVVPLTPRVGIVEWVRAPATKPQHRHRFPSCACLCFRV